MSPLVSHATTTELMRPQTYPEFKLTPADRNELLGDHSAFCMTAVIPDPLPEVPPCRDVADLPFLWRAFIGKADVQASGDKELLALDSAFFSPIRTAEAFIADTESRW